MLKTKYGQTVEEYAEEFINAVRSSKVVSPKLAQAGEDYAKYEADPELAKKEGVDAFFAKHIAHAGVNPNSKLDVRQIAFFKNCQPNVSDALLAWIAMQCEGSDLYLNTVLGCYCTYFYKYNPRDTQLTIAWLNSIVGPGKVFDIPNLARWIICSKTESGKNIFEVMTENDLYVYEDTKPDR